MAVSSTSTSKTPTTKSSRTEIEYKTINTAFRAYRTGFCPFERYRLIIIDSDKPINGIPHLLGVKGRRRWG